MTEPEPLYSCACAVSPRPRSTYREVDVDGVTVLVCGWCRAKVEAVEVVKVKTKRLRRRAE